VWWSVLLKYKGKVGAVVWPYEAEIGRPAFIKSAGILGDIWCCTGAIFQLILTLAISLIVLETRHSTVGAVIGLCDLCKHCNNCGLGNKFHSIPSYLVVNVTIVAQTGVSLTSLWLKVGE